MMYEDGDEEGCKVGVQMHSAGSEKEQVIAVLQKYVEADVAKIRALCEDKTEVYLFMKQKSECETVYQELLAAGADAEILEEDEETEL